MVESRREEGDGMIAKGAWCWNGSWILQIEVKPGVGFFAGHIALGTSANGSIVAPAGTMTVGTWQYIAISATRGEDSFIYRNGGARRNRSSEG